MNGEVARVTRRLESLDEELLREAERYLSLSPQRSRAHLPSELAASLLQPSDPEPLLEAFGEAMACITKAMLHAFPSNLLWDLDKLAATLVRGAKEASDPAAELVGRAERIADLQQRFGQHGPILFSYIHDFIYGFDWARWVARDPATRAAVGPYDPAFIERMHRRGAELAQLIAAGSDPEYPRLDDSRPRNPFGFSRDPDDELALYRHLAKNGWIPVPAWSLHAVPRWDLPFGELRDRAAEELGLGAVQSAGD